MLSTLKRHLYFSDKTLAYYKRMITNSELALFLNYYKASFELKYLSKYLRKTKTSDDL